VGRLAAGSDRSRYAAVTLGVARPQCALVRPVAMATKIGALKFKGVFGAKSRCTIGAVRPRARPAQSKASDRTGWITPPVFLTGRIPWPLPA
jgi:hypothetical protein